MSQAQDFGDIQDLAIAALKTSVTSVKTVEEYAGQLEDAIEGRTAGFPLLAVLFTGEDFEEIDGPSHHEANEFEVGIFVHSLRGAADLKSRSRQLIREVKQCLVNARLAENLESVKPIRLRPIFASDVTRVYGFSFSVAMDQTYQWPG
jgi:hypothetical protein